MSITNLRRLIRLYIHEGAGAKSNKPISIGKVSQTPATASREELEDLTAFDDADLLAPHLSEPQLSPEECWGPVPPQKKNDPGVHSDPWVRDIYPVRSRHIGR